MLLDWLRKLTAIVKLMVDGYVSVCCCSDDIIEALKEDMMDDSDEWENI